MMRLVLMCVMTPPVVHLPNDPTRSSDVPDALIAMVPEQTNEHKKQSNHKHTHTRTNTHTHTHTTNIPM